MNARSVAGWIAVVSGALLAVGMVASAFAASTGQLGAGQGGWPNMMGSGQMGGGMMGGGAMGPGMMSGGMMGGGMHGMMGFGTSGPASTPIPGASEIRVQATNFAFTPNEIRLPKSADVNLAFVNTTGVVHDLTVPGLGIHIVANPGETKTVGLRGLTAGRYDAYCSVPGHGDLGMRATVIVE